MARSRSSALVAAAAAAALAYSTASSLAAFVAGPPRPCAAAGALVARRAEGKKDGEEDEGFLKFLKVEQDIELSPEEYAMAMEQEVESQRKRYYIGGVVKENNLIVPWKPVDEKQLIKDARKQLKKNGILDPAGEVNEDEEDSEIELGLIGAEDVSIEWTAGDPGTKVGYIIEKKRAKDTNFREIATYERGDQSFLLAKPYGGHEYSYADELCEPGSWTFRVLCRYRSGEIQAAPFLPPAGTLWGPSCSSWWSSSSAPTLPTGTSSTERAPVALPGAGRGAPPTLTGRPAGRGAPPRSGAHAHSNSVRFPESMPADPAPQALLSRPRSAPPAPGSHPAAARLLGGRGSIQASLRSSQGLCLGRLRPSNLHGLI
ncbi:unnamed protein product [Prorocentrum cordatum]|uniref:Uncharacterized protein n=1 Tax=Prorocentrum cordatum TaxID=2364126 RepID=A0ABN9TVK1_9DINO|nr:unnamed protein product [Polarella glacialis]